MSAIIQPSYQSGFYSPTRGGVPKYPSLWRGCEAAWCFGLGEDNRDNAIDQTVRKSHGTYDTARPLRGLLSGVRTAYFTAATMNFYTTNYSKSLKDFTVAAWFYPLSAGAFRRIVDMRYDTGFWLGNNGSGAASWGGGANAPATPYGIFLDGTLNAWNFIALKRTGSTQYLYHWSSSLGLRSTSGDWGGGTALDASNAVRIGNSHPGNADASLNWGGGINEVRLYSYALDFGTVVLLASRPGIAYELASGPVRGPALPTVGLLTINEFLAKSVSNIN